MWRQPSATGSWEGCSRRRFCSVSVLNLRHSPYSAASKSHVLVAVAPAVDCALDQAALLAQVGVQLRERPAHGIALAFVVQAIALVLVLPATRPWVDAVRRLELLTELIDVDRLDVAADGILHLHAVARVLERDPLDTIVVLAHHERSSRRNGTWSCARISAVCRRLWWMSEHTWTRGLLWRVLRRRKH